MNRPIIPNGTLDETTVDLVPSLRAVVEQGGLKAKNLIVAFEANSNGQIRLQKHSVPVSDGRRVVSWEVPSLRELFRGDRQPPADMEQYPREYCNHFFLIENQFLTLCDAMGDRTDQEMEEVYSALQRRPDGRSLGSVHDFIWQVAALLLGCYPLSEAEFEALIGALVRSTRKWSLRPISRNYVEFLRNSFGEIHSHKTLDR